IAGAASIDEHVLDPLFAGTTPLETRTPLTETLEALVGRCLRLLPAQHRESAVARLGVMLAKAEGPGRKLTLAESLLAIVFADVDVPPASARLLAPWQRKGLESLRDHG